MNLRQEVELTLLPGLDDTTSVIEWQRRGTRFNQVKAVSSLQRARAWVETHYEEVAWTSCIHGQAMIGALAPDDDWS